MPNLSRQDKEAELRFFNHARMVTSHSDRIGDDPIIEAARKLTEDYSPVNGSVLEVGCGTGTLGRLLARKSSKQIRVTGVDLAPLNIEWSIQHPQRNYTPVVGDVEDVKAFQSQAFDVILSFMFLHHFPSLSASRALENFSTWLKPGGLVIVYEPNGSNPAIRLPNILGRIIAWANPRALHATRNEVTHRYQTYRQEFLRRGFVEIQRTAWTSKSLKVPPGSGWLILVLHVFRRLSLSLTGALPFPWSNANLTLVYKKAR
ncbi:MAG: class I SAM-dependent methyltransferase [Chloroflexi bacterium]|nr:class I SAM-dependent methyltransferase [Chloroflexota bacterium]